MVIEYDLQLKISLGIERFPQHVQHPGQRDLTNIGVTLRMVMMTEQKMANPCMPCSPFHTLLFSSKVIQLEVTKR